jgi:hypothetical protein
MEVSELSASSLSELLGLLWHGQAQLLSKSHELDAPDFENREICR